MPSSQLEFQAEATVFRSAELPTLSPAVVDHGIPLPPSVDCEPNIPSTVPVPPAAEPEPLCMSAVMGLF